MNLWCHCCLSTLCSVLCLHPTVTFSTANTLKSSLLADTMRLPNPQHCFQTLHPVTSNSRKLYPTLSIQHLKLAPVHKWVLFAPCSSRPVIQCHSFPFSSSKWHSRCQPTAGQAENCRGWVHTKHWDKQGLQTFLKTVQLQGYVQEFYNSNDDVFKRRWQCLQNDLSSCSLTLAQTQQLLWNRGVIIRYTTKCFVQTDRDSSVKPVDFLWLQQNISI